MNSGARMSLRSTIIMQRPMAAWASRIPCQEFRIWWLKLWDSLLMARRTTSAENIEGQAIRWSKPIRQSFMPRRTARVPRTLDAAASLLWCAFDYASLINAYAGVKCPWRV